MATIYKVRHQAAGILPEQFDSPPSEDVLRGIDTRLSGAHGAAHPKTKHIYWLKVLEVDASSGETVRTVAGLCRGQLVDGEHADAEASGHCPIRAGEIVPARESGGPSNAGTGKVGVEGVGTVK
jgi:hypothetical protein